MWKILKNSKQFRLAKIVQNPDYHTNLDEFRTSGFWTFTSRNQLATVNEVFFLLLSSVPNRVWATKNLPKMKRTMSQQKNLAMSFTTASVTDFGITFFSSDPNWAMKLTTQYSSVSGFGTLMVLSEEGSSWSGTWSCILVRKLLSSIVQLTSEIRTFRFRHFWKWFGC